MRVVALCPRWLVFPDLGIPFIAVFVVIADRPNELDATASGLSVATAKRKDTLSV